MRDKSGGKVGEGVEEKQKKKEKKSCNGNKKSERRNGVAELRVWEMTILQVVQSPIFSHW